MSASQQYTFSKFHCTAYGLMISSDHDALFGLVVMVLKHDHYNLIASRSKQQDSAINSKAVVKHAALALGLHPLT